MTATPPPPPPRSAEPPPVLAAPRRQPSHHAPTPPATEPAHPPPATPVDRRRAAVASRGAQAKDEEDRLQRWNQRMGEVRQWLASPAKEQQQPEGLELSIGSLVVTVESPQKPAERAPRPAAEIPPALGGRSWLVRS
jgi:hypothetical protein